MSKNEKKVIDQIRYQRENSGLSQLEVSIALGYKSNMIYRIENGTTKPSVDVLSGLNELYGWEFDVNGIN